MNYMTDITKALNNALIQFGIDNTIEIGLNLIDFPTDLTKPFLNGRKVPTSTGVADLGVTDIREGFYQIDINYEKGLGDIPLTEMADLLNQTFYSGASFSFGSVCVNINRVEDGPVIRQTAWATMPLTITFDAYTARI